MPKNQNNNPITKKGLRRELTEFTDEVLLPSMEKTFTTKGELQEAKKEIKKEVKEDVTGATSQLLTKADEVISKLDTLQKEEKAGTALYKRHDKKIEDHEGRIKKLEQTKFAFD